MISFGWLKLSPPTIHLLRLWSDLRSLFYVFTIIRERILHGNQWWHRRWWAQTTNRPNRMTNFNILCKPNKNIIFFIIPCNIHGLSSCTFHQPPPFYRKFSWTYQRYRLRRERRYFVFVSRHSLFLTPSPSINTVFKRHPPRGELLAVFWKRVKCVSDTDLDPTGLSPDIRDFLSLSKNALIRRRFFYIHLLSPVVRSRILWLSFLHGREGLDIKRLQT